MILVIDDDPKITALLKRSLNYEGYQVEVSNTGKEGLDKALSLQPDLVILDIMLPDMEGWDVCKHLRLQSEIPILMLTARDDVSDRVRGLDTGADDYLVKPFALEELLARVRALLRRGKNSKQSSNQSRNQLTYANINLNPATREVTRGGKEIKMTQKEFDLLHFFMLHPRQVLSRETLMEKIWGYDFSGESNVLDVYIGYLRQKLEDGGQPRVIHTVRGVGYRLKEG